MKKNSNIRIFSIFMTSLLMLSLVSTDLYAQWCKKNKELEHIIFSTNVDGKGPEMHIEFVKGAKHNHPLMAIWVEDLDGNYIQTLYVAQSISKGVFAYGDKTTGRWKAGEISRPAALPFWAHKRNIKNDIGNYMPKPGFEVPDAYSGATPKANFTLDTRMNNPVSGKFRVLMEINQSWDWNRHWTNSMFPDEPEYKTSAQPAVVYATEVDAGSSQKTYEMKPLGHSHYAGADGNLYPDLSTLTTALQIVEEVKLILK